MIFSTDIKKQIDCKFYGNLPLGNQNDEIIGKINSCCEDEQAILKLFYATMPLADIGDYDFSLFKKYTDFALFLAKNPLWGAVPQDIFLNYVAYYRVNNEVIEDSREFFYNALIGRIKGKNMKEAALEVNLWCAERAEYKMTDERTASPMTVLKASYGRCGEESTLTVTAMRSVGIPARQVYTPKWAHCDDNHAWVEVWCEGKWYYLGACEPEPTLNRAWFDNAAARAVLVHTKSFLPISGEEIVSLAGQTLVLNLTSRYAASKTFTVTVLDVLPLENAEVRFEMLNSSELAPIATLKTDGDGKAKITLGMGTVNVCATSKGRFIEAAVDTNDVNSLTLDFYKAAKKESAGTRDFDFYAPKDNPKNGAHLTQEQKLLRKEIKSKAEKKLLTRKKSFYCSQEAAKLAALFSRPDEVEDILRGAEGNFWEIYSFLCGKENIVKVGFGESEECSAPHFCQANECFGGCAEGIGENAGSNNCAKSDGGITKSIEEIGELKLELLKSLSQKDLLDSKCAVLQEHFELSLRYQNDFPKEIFIPYIMCPRISYEEITPYRKFLLSVISLEDAELFRRQPLKAWQYVCGFGENTLRQNDRLLGTPQGIFKSGLASQKAKKVLFAVVLRTLGVPARINPVDGSPQYYQGDKFVNVGNIKNENEVLSAARIQKSGRLVLLGGGEKWYYYGNFTLAKLKSGGYQTLRFDDIKWQKGRTELSLESGFYRLITVSRAPNGNQYAKKYCFELKEGENKRLDIAMRQIELSLMATDIAFEPFALFDSNNQEVSSQSFKGKAVFLWLEEQGEPAEHILNELICAKDVLNKIGWAVALIRKESAPADKTLDKTLKALNCAKVFYSDFSQTAEIMARRMYLDPQNMPLLVAAVNGRGVYASGGYNVGAVGLMIKILDLCN